MRPTFIAAATILALATQGAGLFTAKLVEVNGRLGLLLYNLEGGLENAFAFDVVTDESDPQGRARIRNIYVIRNPDKLARLANAVGEEQ